MVKSAQTSVAHFSVASLRSPKLKYSNPAGKLHLLLIMCLAGICWFSIVMVM